MSGPAIDPDAFGAFEEAGWDEQADGYHRFFGPITARAIGPLLDAAAVARGTRVLDVATGPGYLAAACAARGAVAVGVDVAREMVALAARLNPELEFIQADAERLPFDDESFDAVLGSLAVPHFGRPERAAAELARVLAPDGWLGLSMWDLPGRNRVLGILIDAVAEVGPTPVPGIPAGPPIFRFSDDAELAGLLTGAGLADVTVATVSFTHRVGGVRELWEGLLGGTVRSRALLLGQSQEVRSRIRAVFDRLAGEYADGDGLELPVSFKVASGRKA